MSLTPEQIKEVATYGFYYNPSASHYNSVSSNTTNTVNCDCCGKKNILACIGYGEHDLCLLCAYIVTASDEDKQHAVQLSRGMNMRIGNSFTGGSNIKNDQPTGFTPINPTTQIPLTPMNPMREVPLTPMNPMREVPLTPMNPMREVPLTPQQIQPIRPITPYNLSNPPFNPLGQTPAPFFPSIVPTHTGPIFFQQSGLKPNPDNERTFNFPNNFDPMTNIGQNFGNNQQSPQGKYLPTTPGDFKFGPKFPDMYK
jgi:hypothetical protein